MSEYTVVREGAERMVIQWNSHYDPRLEEPAEVAVARHLLQLLDLVQQASNANFKSLGANGALNAAVNSYYGIKEEEEK